MLFAGSIRRYGSMEGFVYDVEVQGLGLTCSMDPSSGEASIRIGQGAVVYDDLTDPLALIHATYGLARIVEGIGRDIERDQGTVPFAYVDDSTDRSDAIRAHEQSYLFTEFFRRGLLAARFAHEHAHPSVRAGIADLITELSHTYTLTANIHETIREAIERAIGTEEHVCSWLDE
jgi:hypothetical protein